MWLTRLGRNRSRTWTTTPKCGTPSRRCFNSRVNCKQCDPEKQNRCLPPHPEPASMSRLFEALQRSEPETLGFDFAPHEPPVSNLLKKTEATPFQPTHPDPPTPPNHPYHPSAQVPSP